MKDSVEKKHTNASPSLSGWNFQVAAAIYLFLSMIKDVSEIGLEKTEDIELKLNNGKIIFVQAKSSHTPDEIEFNSHYPEIKKGISTLEGRDESLIEKLIVIFNYYKPFGNDTVFDVVSYDKKRYIDLNSKVQKKLSEEIETKQYQINLDTLEFWALKFDGIDQHSSTLQFLRETLTLGNTGHYKNIIESWRILLYDNGVQTKRYIEKQILAGSVFKEYLDSNISDDVLESLNIDIYSGDIEDIYAPEYRKYIDILCKKFSLLTEINSYYYEYKRINRGKMNKSDMLCSFVKTEYNNVSTGIRNLFADVNDAKKDILIKILLYKIVYKYNIIDEISEVMGL